VIVETDDLIRRLVTSAHPIRRLPPPWLRTVQWLSIALPAVGIVVILMSLRNDLAEKFVEARFLIEQAAALATAVTAAIAAFYLVVPGYSRKLALLPVLPLTIWLGSLGQGCLQNWLRFGDGAWQIYPDWICFPSIVMVGAVPALTMVAMLRRGSPMAPQITVALGALAAAALGNFGLRLFHYQDASLMVLVWQFGSVALVTALAGWRGKHILHWSHVRMAG
jgi:hypothetical protein